MGVAFNGATDTDVSGFVVRVPRPEKEPRTMTFEAVLKDETRQHVQTVTITDTAP